MTPSQVQPDSQPAAKFQRPSCLAPAQNPGWGKDEVGLWSIPVGHRFRSVTPYKVTTGTVIEHYAGCVMVRLDGKAETVHIGDAEFVSRRSRNTYFARETAVEYVGPGNSTSSSPSQDQNSNSEETTTMPRTATATARKSTKAATKARVPKGPKLVKKSANQVAVNPEPVATGTVGQAPPLVATEPTTPEQLALIARWKMAVQKLGQMLKIDGPVDQCAAQRDRIRAIYDEAIMHQVVLPFDAIQYPDPIFIDMELGATVAQVINQSTAVGSAQETPSAAAPVPTEAASDPVPVSEAQPTKKAARKATKKAGAGKSAASKSNGVARSKKPKELHPCLEGCGAQVAGNFKQGHDARYRGLILRVERGEIKESELPAYMRKNGGVDGNPLSFKETRDGLRCTNSILNH